jgi:large subunit ribosomal protein L25
MEEVVLNAQARTIIGKQVRALRRQGLLPAVVYGHNVEPINIVLDQHTTDRLLPRLSPSQLVTIAVEGGPRVTVLVREKQRNPITGQMIHIDFQAISMTEKIRLMVRVVLKGEAPAVKIYGAIIVTSREELEIEALPGDLPSSIEVDVTGLKSIGDAVHVRDLNMSDKIAILAHPEDVLVIAAAPESETEGVEGATFEPEVIEKGKKEEED